MDDATGGDHKADDGYEIAEPGADSLIHSLRAFGYDLATALADLIDNSISAGAQNVWLEFYWSGARSTISVTADGRGMSTAQLHDAMRPGSRSPLEAREPGDLGRFGLGLKTASFSQAKSLTVGTKQGGTISVRRWDLDVVSAAREWRLLKNGTDLFRARAIPSLENLPSGTVVFWQRLDRLVPETAEVSDAHAQSQFLGLTERVRTHLAMVFHRFLRPDIPGQKRLRIWLGKQEIRPWDPFLADDPATRLLAVENLPLPGGTLTVRPYVLPHHSKLSRDAHERAAGPRGWNAQQGFYVYRNRRLLVAGSWLGLKELRQEEHYKLARILIDIPNSMDAGWGIDVKKSRAYPPAVVRQHLSLLATRTRAEAAKAYRFRGARLHPGRQREVVFLWDAKTLRGKVAYRVNRDHPVVRAAVEAGGSPVSTLLRLVEETVPVPTILQQGMEDPTALADPFESGQRAELLEAMRSTYRKFLAMGEDPQEARELLLHIDPFYRFPELIATLDERDHPENGFH
jgi:hypothetical protein